MEGHFIIMDLLISYLMRSFLIGFLNSELTVLWNPYMSMHSPTVLPCYNADRYTTVCDITYSIVCLPNCHNGQLLTLVKFVNLCSLIQELAGDMRISSIFNWKRYCYTIFNFSSYSTKFVEMQYMEWLPPRRYVPVMKVPKVLCHRIMWILCDSIIRRLPSAHPDHHFIMGEHCINLRFLCLEDKCHWVYAN